jgi:hypothetical protein
MIVERGKEKGQFFMYKWQRRKENSSGLWRVIFEVVESGE